MIALLVGIINGVFDIIYNFQRTFEASVVNEHGESLKVKVIADSGRPPLLWYLAWRVGSNPITTVNIGVTITPSATNVVDLKVTYYIKAKCGTLSYNPLSGNQISASSGSPLSYSTGAVNVDTHLTNIGVSTTQDQTVDYYVYCKVEGTGAISGETLVAEITETKFDTILYDYGAETTNTFEAYGGSSGNPRQVESVNYETNAIECWYTGIGYGGKVGKGSSGEFHALVRFTDVTIPQGTNIAQAIVKVPKYKDSGNLGTLPMRIRAIDQASATFPSSVSEYDSWTQTDAYVDLVYPNDVSPTNNEDGLKTFPEVTYIVQEIIDRTDWVSGNDIVFVFRPTSSTPANTWIVLHDYSSAHYLEETEIDWSASWINTPCELEITYVGHTASWNWFNLPLSVVSLPIGSQLVAILIFLVLYFAWLIRYVDKRKKKGKGKKGGKKKK